MWLMENTEFRQTWGPGWALPPPSCASPGYPPLQLVAVRRWASCWPAEERGGCRELWGSLGRLEEARAAHSSLCGRRTRLGPGLEETPLAVTQAGLAL